MNRDSTTTIYLDGQVWKSSTRSGTYAIADAYDSL